MKFNTTVPLRHQVPSVFSFPEKLLKIVARGEIISFKFTNRRLADPLGKLKRSPDPLAVIRGSTSKGKERKGREDREREKGDGEEGMGGAGAPQMTLFRTTPLTASKQ